MGIFFEPVEERAAAQALELANGLDLPVIARSQKANVVRGKGCLLAGIVIALSIALAILVVALIAGIGARGGSAGWQAIGYVLVLGFAFLCLSGLRRGWRGRRSDYVDPELAIEAGAEGVTFSRPGASRSQSYGEIRAQVLSIAVRHSVRFLGLELQSPLGPIRLDDALFVNGRNTAAAILLGMKRAGRTTAGGR